jgi:hypothetical protein
MYSRRRFLRTTAGAVSSPLLNPEIRPSGSESPVPPWRKRQLDRFSPSRFSGN